MVNQASLTGEGLPVKKEVDGYVYAGTVVEEGELTICVKKVSGNTRYEKVIAMIEESEKLKSGWKARPNIGRSAGSLYVFGNRTCLAAYTQCNEGIVRLMVDFSCALKLAMPITVLSAIREASASHITVKRWKIFGGNGCSDHRCFSIKPAL